MLGRIVSAVRRHKWKTVIAIAAIVFIAWGYRWLTRPEEPEYVTALVKRGDLVQIVEAVGTVTSERDLRLQFPISGVVDEVNVSEGDAVEAGQVLATLRAEDFSATVRSASASLQAAQAELNELLEGMRPEDLAIAEAKVENKRASLQAAEETLVAAEEKREILEREAQTALVGEIAVVRSTVTKQLTTARTALAVVDDILDDGEVIDALTRYSPGEEKLIRSDRQSVSQIITRVLLKEIDFETAADALSSLSHARAAILETAGVVDRLFDVVVSVPPTTSFTTSDRETRKTDLNTEKDNLQGGLSALDSAMKSLKDLSANFETKIAAENSTIAGARGDILELKTALRTEEAELAKARAGARQTEIDAARARVNQAAAELARHRADYDDTILVSPSAGTITKVNVKTGELLSTAFQQEPAITMLGETPYRIEVFVAEVDIPKVSTGQKASVELDAFPGEPFAMIVAEIDPAATDVDGVPKYLVKLDFTRNPDGVRIGMTGDTDIFTGERADVLMVPARAVIETETGDDAIRILRDDDGVEERLVETGMEGENDVEIIRGVEEGEVVVVLVKK